MAKPGGLDLNLLKFFYLASKETTQMKITEITDQCIFPDVKMHCWNISYFVQI